MTTHTRLSALVCVLAVTAVAACGSTTDDPAPAAAAKTGAPTAFTPATSGELSLYTWSDYFPTDLAQRFTQETGIKLTVSYYDSNETLEAKLKASGGSGYDLVVPSDYMVDILAKDGLLKPVNATSLPNGKNIRPEFLDVYFDKGRQYTVPYLYGTTGYAYDSKVVTTPMTTWKDYFNPPPAAVGKIGIFADQVEVVTAALRATGGQSCTKDPNQLQAAQDLLTGFKGKVLTITSEGNHDRLATGENVVGMVWNGAAHRAKEKRPSLVYVYPADGTALWQDNFAMPKGAENEQQALTFLNWFLEPKNAAEAANYQGYNSGITGVDALLSPELKADPAVVVPAKDLPNVKAIPKCDTQSNNAYTKIFESFKK